VRPPAAAPAGQPPAAPPLFAAIAADDPLFPVNFGLIENWRKANRGVEFHYYERGGHGFGMYPKDTTSTGWFDAYVKWLGMHGHLKPKKPAASLPPCSPRPLCFSPDRVWSERLNHRGHRGTQRQHRGDDGT
jgi:hypothetical protein